MNFKNLPEVKIYQLSSEKIAVFTKMLFKVKSAVDTFWATLGENRLPFIPTSGHTYYISLLAGQKRLIVRRYWSQSGKH